jgi:hypothetical protein
LLKLAAPLGQVFLNDAGDLSSLCLLTGKSISRWCEPLRHLLGGGNFFGAILQDAVDRFLQLAFRGKRRRRHADRPSSSSSLSCLALPRLHPKLAEQFHPLRQIELCPVRYAVLILHALLEAGDIWVAIGILWDALDGILEPRKPRQALALRSRFRRAWRRRWRLFCLWSYRSRGGGQLRLYGLRRRLWHPTN